jgi:hypothetical protein
MTTTTTLSITGATDVDAIIDTIPFCDMRSHALEIHEWLRAVDPTGSAPPVLVLCDVGGVTVLWSPVYDYAFANAGGPGVGDSVLIPNGECSSPEYAAAVWRGEEPAY